MTQGNRLYKTAALITGIGSGGTFTFQPVPQGTVYTGTVQVLSAPSWAFNQATIGGILWAEWYGYQPSPVLQAIGGEVIEVVSSGLLPLATYQSSLIGRIDPEDDYNAVWPEPSITSITPTVPDQTFPVALAINFTASINAGIPGQVLGIQFNSTGGTATGLRITATAFPGTQYRTLYPYPANVAGVIAPWWFIPVFDPIVNIFVQPIINGILSGLLLGQLNVVTLPGPLNTPYLQNPIDPSGSLGGPIGQEANVSPGAGGTAVAIPNNPTGTIIKVRSISITNTASPAAAQAIEAKGSVSGRLYRRFIAPVAPVAIEDYSQFYLGDSGLTDTTEGLTYNNLTSIAVNTITTYDILAYPQGDTYND